MLVKLGSGYYRADAVVSINLDRYHECGDDEDGGRAMAARFRVYVQLDRSPFLIGEYPGEREANDAIDGFSATVNAALGGEGNPTGDVACYEYGVRVIDDGGMRSTDLFGTDWRAAAQRLAERYRDLAHSDSAGYRDPHMVRRACGRWERFEAPEMEANDNDGE